jgi:hypothetical protein
VHGQRVLRHTGALPGGRCAAVRIAAADRPRQPPPANNRAIPRRDRASARLCAAHPPVANNNPVPVHGPFVNGPPRPPGPSSALGPAASRSLGWRCPTSSRASAAARRRNGLRDNSSSASACGGVPFLFGDASLGRTGFAGWALHVKSAHRARVLPATEIVRLVREGSRGVDCGGRSLPLRRGTTLAGHESCQRRVTMVSPGSEHGWAVALALPPVRGP